MALPDFAKARVLVAGDLMLDSYWHGATTRISPEAPVPVVQVQQQENRVGGAGNVAVNVAGLGAQVRLWGLVGNDNAASQLEQMLIAHKVQPHLHRVEGSSTINKLRIISRHQQLIRLDFEDHFPAWQPDAFLSSFKQTAQDVDVAIFSDYAKGALRGVQALIAHARCMNLPVIVDPKGNDFEPYRGATLLTPNLSEFEAVVGHCNSEDELIDRANRLRSEFDLHALLITRSEQGMSLFVENQPPMRLPTQAREVFDVTGAGDTVAAMIGAGLAAGLELAEAVVLANIGAGIVVGKMGTASVTVGELQTGLSASHPLQSGASVSGVQAPIWIYEGALSRPEEKHGTTLHTVCAVKLVDGTQQIDGSRGMSAPEDSARALQRVGKAQTLRKSDEISGDFL